jgi:C-terminal topoisomerase domain
MVLCNAYVVDIELFLFIQKLGTSKGSIFVWAEIAVVDLVILLDLQIFNKSLLAKFAWAMDVEPSYRF